MHLRSRRGARSREHLPDRPADLPPVRRGHEWWGRIRAVTVAPDGRSVAYLHQSNTEPAEVWFGERRADPPQRSRVSSPRLASPRIVRVRRRAGGFGVRVGAEAAGASMPRRSIRWSTSSTAVPRAPGTTLWHARWNYQMFASRGYVVAAVNFHGSTGYGQAFTDAISQHWGDYPYEDLMKGLDVVSRLPYVDSTRMGAAGASYGGYMIYWLAGHTDRFKVLVAHDGVFNTESMYGSTEELWFVEWGSAARPYGESARSTRSGRRSTTCSAGRRRCSSYTPRLDYRVDLSEGYQAFTAASGPVGVPAKFLYFPDEGHWVLRPRNRRLWWRYRARLVGRVPAVREPRIGSGPEPLSHDAHPQHRGCGARGDRPLDRAAASRRRSCGISWMCSLWPSASPSSDIMSTALLLAVPDIARRVRAHRARPRLVRGRSVVLPSSARWLLDPVRPGPARPSRAAMGWRVPREP